MSHADLERLSEKILALLHKFHEQQLTAQAQGLAELRTVYLDELHGRVVHGGAAASSPCRPEDFTYIVRQLVDEQVFFSVTKLEEKLQNKLEVEGVRPQEARREWLRLNIRAVWDYQHKARSEKIAAIMAKYRGAMTGVPNAFDTKFAFEQHPKWPHIIAGLSPAWQAYAGVCIAWTLEHNSKNSLPTRGVELRALYAAWTNALDRLFPAVALNIAASVQRPKSPPYPARRVRAPKRRHRHVAEEQQEDEDAQQQHQRLRAVHPRVANQGDRADAGLQQQQQQQQQQQHV